jgi:hypothetical protein
MNPGGILFLSPKIKHIRTRVGTIPFNMTVILSVTAEYFYITY